MRRIATELVSHRRIKTPFLFTIFAAFLLYSSSTFAFTVTGLAKDMVFQSSCDKTGALLIEFDEDDIKAIAEHLSPANTPRLNSTYSGPRGNADYVLITVTLNYSSEEATWHRPVLCKEISESNSSPIYGASGELLPVQNAVPLQRIGKEVSNTTHSLLTTSKGAPACSGEQDVLAYVAGQQNAFYFSIFITDIENNVPSDDNPHPWNDSGNRPWIRVGLDTYEVGNLDNDDCVHGHNTEILVDVSGCSDNTATLIASVDVQPENLTGTMKNTWVGYFIDPYYEDLYHEIVLSAESREMVFQRKCDQTGTFELKFTQSAVEMIAEHLSPLNTPKLNASYTGLRGSANYVLLEVTLEPLDNSNPADPLPALCTDINTSNSQEIQGAAGEPLPEDVQDAAPLQIIDIEVSNIVQSSSAVSESGTYPDERDVVAYVWGKEGDSRFYIYIVDIENNMFRIDNPEPWNDENNWPWIKVGLNPYQEEDGDYFNGILRTIWVDVSGYDSADSQAALRVSVKSTVEDLTCCSTNSQIGHFDDGLVAYYTLDGKAEDESGNENHGTEYGGLDYVQGIYGQAASFDGIDDKIIVPHKSTLAFGKQPFSISFWIKTAMEGDYFIITKEDNDSGVAYAIIMGEMFDFSPWFKVGLSSTDHYWNFEHKSVADGQWHHIVAVRSSDDSASLLTLSIDGELDYYEFQEPTTDVSNENPIVFGAWQGSDENLFHGVLDEIRIYDIALSDEEIIDLYENSIPPPPPKAIIVTGGGPKIDNIREGIQWCGNYAYRNLLHQGYSKDSICYLTDGTVPDLDENGMLDDQDGTSTIESLEHAITEWAQDAGDLILYMLGHGGEGSFRLNDTQLVKATDLDSWLDELEAVIPGQVVLIYDACQSGSFIKELSSPMNKRILVSSAGEDEAAIFADQGTVSFSHFFWSRLAGGDSFYDAFTHAENSIALVTDFNQMPGIDTDGNHIANEKTDRETASDIRIGDQIAWLSEIPSIGNITPSRNIQSGDSITIYAEDVVDENGIDNVTAMITPPGTWEGSADIPLSDLPQLELLPVGNDRYEAVYDGFSMEGIYSITILAEDSHGTISMPRTTKVTAEDNYQGSSTTLYYPFARSDNAWETEIAVTNTSSESELNGTFAAYNSSGTAVGSPLIVTLPPLGRKQLTIGQDFSDPETICYVVFHSNEGDAVGYQRPYHGSKCRAAIPAGKSNASDTIYVPHIASDQSWWTLISLLNTGEETRNLSFEFNDGSTRNLILAPGQCSQDLLKNLFDGVPQEGIHSAEIKNAREVAGLELFGTKTWTLLSGVWLSDQLSDKLYYPHIASDNEWDTGLVAYNPAADSCAVTITPYTELGMSLDAQELEIPAKGRYFGVVSRLDLPESTAWMKIEAQNPLAGFELFSRKNETQIAIAIAGYTGINLAKTKGTLPLLENDGFTGIAFVNVGEDNATVVVTALNDAGSEVDRTEVVLSPFQKYVGQISELFQGNISRATYFTYASAKKVVMFQLNMSSDWQMLDALPGL